MKNGFVLSADVHLADSPSADYRWDIFRFLRVTADRHQTKEIVIAGDLVDKKDRHPASFVNRVVKEVVDLASAGYSITIMSGNHDYSDPACPFFSFLTECHPLVQYVTEPSVWGIGGLECLLIPHSKSGIKCRTSPREGSYDVILCHQTFKGAHVNGRELSGLSVDRLSRQFVGDARVFSGDIHEPQVVGNVQYIGAPYHIAFGDTYEGRVLVVREDDHVVVPYLTAPKKHNLKISASEIDSDWLEGVFEGDFVRVNLLLTPEQALDVVELRKRVRDSMTDVVCCGILVDVAAPKKRRSRLFEQESWDDKSVFSRYCESHDVPKELRQFAKDIYGV